MNAKALALYKLNPNWILRFIYGPQNTIENEPGAQLRMKSEHSQVCSLN